MYIMRRTQLYLDDHLWSALHTQARSRKTSVSELVREAMRERYLGKREEQAKAMQEFVGIRKDSAEPVDAVKYIRSLRRSNRLGRLNSK
jgi:metal-responsive CopG/Arc/MetJ family transcriptional regulator